jgi:hypothetical protein
MKALLGNTELEFSLKTAPRPTSRPCPVALCFNLSANGTRLFFKLGSESRIVEGEIRDPNVFKPFGDGDPILGLACNFQRLLLVIVYRPRRNGG